MIDERWLKILDEAMDEQVASLEKDPHRENPFTRHRIIQIWKWRKEAMAGLEASPCIKFYQEAI